MHIGECIRQSYSINWSVHCDGVAQHAYDAIGRWNTNLTKSNQYI